MKITKYNSQEELIKARGSSTINDLLEEIINYANINKPVDIIELSEKQDTLLQELWINSKFQETELGYIPSDLFFTGTIPLPLFDCVFTTIEQGQMKVRFIPIDIDMERLNSYQPTDVMRIFLYNERLTKKPLSCADICIKKGENEISIQSHTFLDYSLVQKLKNNGFWETVNLELQRNYVEVLKSWYGIQIALLHPTVKFLFQNPQTIGITDNKSSKKSKGKRKVKYVKVIRINTEELSSAIYGNNTKFNRKALIWAVIGHWRKYQNGKSVFVKPYFKGALRESNIALTEQRERVIEPGVISK